MRWLTISGLLGVLLVACVATFGLRGPVNVTVIGDGADDVGVPRMAASRVAKVDGVLLRRAENLRYLTDVSRLCRGRCAPGVTVLHEAGPGGLRKVAVFELSQEPGIEAMDAGEGLPAPVAACIADILRAEAAVLWRPDAQPCLPLRRYLVLPYGL